MSMLILILFGILILGGGIAALYIEDTVSAIVAAGVVSLLASLVYLIVGAPDVAMTEAAIGSALTTVVFLFAWSRIRSNAEAEAEAEDEVFAEEMHTARNEERVGAEGKGKGQGRRGKREGRLGND
jgi:energy-converting hydrogenase B subunit D